MNNYARDKRRSRILAAVLSAVLVLTMTPLLQSGQYAYAADAWDGTADISWYTADPTALLYDIGTPEELAGLAEIVNREEGSDNFAGKTVTLTNDLDLNGIAWTPIGYRAGPDNIINFIGDHPFSGTFEGNGHSIEGLLLSGSFDRQGLFGGLFGADVKDLKITVSASVSADGLGGLAGYAERRNTGEKGSNGGAIYAETHLNGIEVNGNLKNTKGYTGGILGNGSSLTVISGCINNAGITGTDTAVATGGIAGYPQYGANKITDCKNTGAISGVGFVGGIIGYLNGQQGEVLNSYNKGTVTVNSPSGAGGGIIGYLRAAGAQGSLHYEGSTIDQCFNLGTVQGTATALGGIVGDTWKATVAGGSSSNPTLPSANRNNITNCYNTAPVTNSLEGGYAGGIMGHNQALNNNGFQPTLWNVINHCYNAGTVTANNGFIGAILGGWETPAGLSTSAANYYLSGSAPKGNGSLPQDSPVFIKFEASGDYSNLIASLGSLFVSDIRTGGGYKHNDGFPILRWQDPKGELSYLTELAEDLVNPAKSAVSFDGKDVSETLYWVTGSKRSAINAALLTARPVLEDADADTAQITGEVNTLKSALPAAISRGTLEPLAREAAVHELTSSAISAVNSGTYRDAELLIITNLVEKGKAAIANAKGADYQAAIAATLSSAKTAIAAVPQELEAARIDAIAELDAIDLNRYDPSVRDQISRLIAAAKAAINSAASAADIETGLSAAKENIRAVKAEDTQAKPAVTPPAETPQAATPQAPPVKVIGLKIKKAKKGFILSWKKAAAAAGYEIKYTADKKFRKSVKTKIIRKNTTTRFTAKKLKAKKTYYVKIRAYKTADGKKLYSAYSKVKKVKVK